VPLNKFTILFLIGYSPLKSSEQKLFLDVSGFNHGKHKLTKNENHRSKNYGRK